MEKIRHLSSKQLTMRKKNRIYYVIIAHCAAFELLLLTDTSELPYRREKKIKILPIHNYTSPCSTLSKSSWLRASYKIIGICVNVILCSHDKKKVDKSWLVTEALFLNFL